MTSYADTVYLEAVQQHTRHIIELDGRFGGTDLAPLAVRFFRSVHQQLGSGAYEPSLERDLQAAVGELAKVALLTTAHMYYIEVYSGGPVEL